MLIGAEGTVETVRRIHPGPGVWCALLLLAAALPGLAARRPFQLYSSDRGLSSLNIECITQDSNRVLWVGTRNGLFRYAGRKFELFSGDHPLPSPRVWALQVHQGRLWVGTTSGPAVWNGSVFDIPRQSNGLPYGDQVYDIASQGGRLFLGTQDGLFEAVPASSGQWSLEKRDAPGRVLSLHAALDGSLWVGGRNTLVQFDLQTGKSTSRKMGLPDLDWRAIATTGEGSLWVRSARELWRLRPGSPRFEPAGYAVPNSYASCHLTALPDGSLAVPSPAGLHRWSVEGWSVFDESNGLPSSFATCVHVDHEGSLWVGLGATGVARMLGHGRWLSWTTADGLPHAAVFSIARASDGVWVGTQYGIARLAEDHKAGRVLGPIDGLPDDAARSLAVDSQGFLWVGYSESGVVRLPLQGGAPQHFGPAEGLGDERIVWLTRGPQGRLWVCTRAGLYVATTGPGTVRFESFPLPEAAQGRTIYHVGFDRDGALWMSSSRGLFRYAGGRWEVFGTAEGLLGQAVVFLSPTSRPGEIWIGYGGFSGASRVRYRGGRLELEHHSTRNGSLRSDDLNFVEVDGQDRVWVGTDRGVDVFDGAGWHQFGAENGVVWPDTVVNAFLGEPNGLVWIGTNRGLSQFEAPTTLAQPPALATWLLETSFGSGMTAPSGARIPWRDRRFSVRFAPATFEYESLARSRFRLLGLQANWTVAAEPTENFASLAPGSYRLEVQSSADGVHWNGQTASYEFRILPPWWLAWWAQASGVVLLLGLLYGGLRLGWRHQLARQFELERQVDERARVILEQQQSLVVEKAIAIKASRAATESDRRFHSLLETIQLAAIILDPDGRVSYCNEHLLNLTGWTADEMIGRPWLETFIPAAERDYVASLFAPGRPAPPFYECSVICRNGGERVIQWNNTELRGDDGESMGVAGVGQDVTEQRRREESHREAQKLESLGRLAGGIAHDFNNLLTVISGYANLLLGKLSPDTPLYRNASEIRRAGERAAEFTRQLLAFSRRQMVQPKPVSINSVVSDSEGPLQRLLGEDIRFETSLGSTQGTVLADAGEIHQVLMNLAANARDAMTEGGSLRIETCDADVDHDGAGGVPPGAYSVLTVSDTGSGMDEETRKHIFEPFFTRKPHGRGLGLSMVYGIVRQCGGAITVDTAPGKGTCFRVYLPRHAQPAPAEDQGEDRQEPLSSTNDGAETILVVEDQPEVRQLAAHILASSGYRVLEAGSGAEALETARIHLGPIHLLLTDVVMPEMNGDDLAHKLAELRPETRVLFVSGYSRSVISKNGETGPEVAFLAKPFQPAQLIAKVRAILQADTRA